ncbi:MAG: 3'-5' exonuclease [Deltaproteobacteria bacterium]|nr:3'-5' exonuclease [Deltaproteobacteria bacterium]
MRHVVFDTETTGIPKDRRAPVTKLANWPRLVQVAWVTYDRSGAPGRAGEHLVRPEGFRIPAAASRVHGIRTAHALANGAPMADVLAAFLAAAEPWDTVFVAHNLDFDRPVLGAELLRTGYPLDEVQAFLKRPALCLMKASAPFCRIPGRCGKWKYPTLAELHTKLFDEPPAESHRALADVEAAARCFFELRRRGVVG